MTPALPAPPAFDVLTSMTVPRPSLYASIARGVRSWGSPFEAFPSHLVPSPLVRGNESRAGGNVSVPSRPLPTYRLRARFPSNNRGVTHPGRFLGFPPSENPTTACELSPQTVRCSLGFGLCKDFSLSAPSPPSRTFRSRTCPLRPKAAGMPLNGFLCGEVGCPSQRPSLLPVAAVGMPPFLKFMRSHFGMNSGVPNRNAGLKEQSSNHVCHVYREAHNGERKFDRNLFTNRRAEVLATRRDENPPKRV